MANEVRIDALMPPEMAGKAEAVGMAKTRLDFWGMFILAVLAGAFIAMGAELATVVGTESGLGYGLNRLAMGLVFSLGLILVVVGGAELFTGNNLIIMAWAGGKVSTAQLLRNWTVVYLGNFVGSVATVAIMFVSRQWTFHGYGVGVTALNIASAKVNLGFAQAVALGIFCNTLVCLALWICFSAFSTTDKILCITPPITAFVASGFEHSVANMYFIPMGILLRGEPQVLEAAGKTAADLANLTWGGFLVDNLLPVTIGNIIGGGLMVAAVYWFIYLRGKSGPASL